ncbi:Hypothetical_protein [Hexamita inflata]|uniref:Hypothetical_protein n=1 Tax=Hexamita inflata TaxID=28002 RepID=A0ABP1GER8_9EUKA
MRNRDTRAERESGLRPIDDRPHSGARASGRKSALFQLQLFIRTYSSIHKVSALFSFSICFYIKSCLCGIDVCNQLGVLECQPRVQMPRYTTNKTYGVDVSPHRFQKQFQFYIKYIQFMQYNAIQTPQSLGSVLEGEPPDLHPSVLGPAHHVAALDSELDLLDAHQFVRVGLPLSAGLSLSYVVHDYLTVFTGTQQRLLLMQPAQRPKLASEVAIQLTQRFL